MIILSKLRRRRGEWFLTSSFFFFARPHALKDCAGPWRTPWFTEPPRSKPSWIRAIGLVGHGLTWNEQNVYSHRAEQRGDEGLPSVFDFFIDVVTMEQNAVELHTRSFRSHF